VRHYPALEAIRAGPIDLQVHPLNVLPTPEQAKADGIDIVSTKFQHTDMSDRGPDSVKEKIQATLDHFLCDSAVSELAPVNAEKPIISNGPKNIGR
jgi:hypothetical protein